MKKFLVLIAVMAMLGMFIIPAFAETVTVEYFDKDAHKDHNHDAIRTTEVTVHDPEPAAVAIHNTAGAKIDAPNLVRFTENLTLGLEGGKDIWQNVGYPDEKNLFEDDLGYFGYVKMTYTGTLFDLSKK